MPDHCVHDGHLPSQDLALGFRGPLSPDFCQRTAVYVCSSFELCQELPGARPKAAPRPQVHATAPQLPSLLGHCKAEPILRDILALLRPRLPTTQRLSSQGRTSSAQSACAGLSVCLSDSSFATLPVVSSFSVQQRPAIRRINEALLRDPIFPKGFLYSSIQINSPNCQSKDHEDSNNIGPSLIVGVGRYEGGALEILLGGVWQPFDTQGKYLLFDGSVTHRTANFTGDRYSLVLFMHKSIQRAPNEVKINLDDLGFRWQGPRLYCVLHRPGHVRRRLRRSGAS